MKNISNLVLDVWVDRGAVHSTDTRSMYTLDNGEKPSLGRVQSPVPSNLGTGEILRSEQ